MRVQEGLGGLSMGLSGLAMQRLKVRRGLKGFKGLKVRRGLKGFKGLKARRGLEKFSSSHFNNIK